MLQGILGHLPRVLSLSKDRGVKHLYI